MQADGKDYLKVTADGRMKLDELQTANTYYLKVIADARLKLEKILLLA